jgi:hypothetical protein
MKFSIALSILILSGVASAQSVSQVLSAQLATIQRKMGKGSSDTMAANLYRARGRSDAFAVQGVARLFDKENPVFKDLKKDAKRLEDILGQIDKWDSLRNKASMDTEMRNLGAFIRETNLQTKLGDYARKISTVNITEIQTRRVVIDGIKDEVDDILKKQYDFTYGETGLHELRRNLRWPLIELDAFKNHFTIRPSTCRSSELYNYGRKSSFIALKQNVRGAQEINYCSYIEMIGAVDYLGRVKDDLEKKGLLEKQVSPDIRAIAERTLKDLKEQVLPNIF